MVHHPSHPRNPPACSSCLQHRRSAQVLVGVLDILSLDSILILLLNLGVASLALLAAILKLGPQAVEAGLGGRCSKTKLVTNCFVVNLGRASISISERT